MGPIAGIIFHFLNFPLIPKMNFEIVEILNAALSFLSHSAVNVVRAMCQAAGQGLGPWPGWPFRFFRRNARQPHPHARLVRAADDQPKKEKEKQPART